MTNYTQVQEALAKGADPSHLCATCPWDRPCITPPDMTKADVDAQYEEARRKDEASAAEAEARGEEAGMPVGLLMTALAVGGKHLSAQCCPVYVLRLRSSEGRRLADQTRAAMQNWDDEA